MIVLIVILTSTIAFTIGYSIGSGNKEKEIEAERSILTKIVYVDEERAEIKALQDAGYKIISIEPFNQVLSKIESDILHYRWTQVLVKYEKI